MYWVWDVWVAFSCVLTAGDRQSYELIKTSAAGPPVCHPSFIAYLKLKTLQSLKERSVQLTSGGVDIDLESPVRSDDAVVIVVVEVCDVVAVHVVEAELLQSHRYLAEKRKRN